LARRARAKPAAPSDPVSAYARTVLDGAVPACKWVRLACERHFRDLERQQTAAFPYWLDAAEADKRIRFFSVLRHSKGKSWAGKPFTLEPWQQFIVGTLFGWKRTADNLRRFRTAYESIPRKNGKSTKAAGVGINLTFFDGEPGAEGYSAATKKDQARIVWEEARRMVRGTPALLKRIKPWTSSLTRLANNQSFQPLGADADTLDGLNPHVVIIDELHAHKTRAVVDVLESAVGSRDQPMQFEITTAGFDQQSVCFEHEEYSKQILERVFDDETWFAYIATIDEGDDWRDEKAWIKANPNWGISVKADDMRRLGQQAERRPQAQNNFKTKRLNIWTEQEERWLAIEAWDTCAEPPVDRAALAGRPCVAGIDLSATTDLNALVLLFPEDDWQVLPFFWLPEARVDAGEAGHKPKDRVRYDVWRDAGALEVTPGNVTDYAFIRKRVNELREEFHLLDLGYDPWNATQLMVELESDSVTLVKVPQTFSGLTAASKELEKRVAGGEGAARIRHGGHPVLRWNAANVCVDTDANGNIKPSKKKSRQRIDGIVALVMAIDRATRQAGGSVYDERGIATL
jgi:phage terminase large subunit-like protein